MKNFLIFALACLIISICLADSEQVKTLFTDADAADLGHNSSLFVGCTPVASNLLRCKKTQDLITQQRGAQKRFAINFETIGLSDKYIYVVVTPKCHRIVREISVPNNEFFGTEICI
jgi:hypothetical protein